MRRVFIIIVMLLMLLFLLSTVLEAPRFGDGTSPCNNYVSKKYIEDAPTETGVVNVVTGIILDYRAFDTLGETTVIFTAVIAVMAVLGKGGEEH